MWVEEKEWRPRKPRDIPAKCEVQKWGKDYTVALWDTGFMKAKDCRRVAKFLLAFAAWIEFVERKKK